MNKWVDNIIIRDFICGWIHISNRQLKLRINLIHLNNEEL